MGLNTLKDIGSYALTPFGIGLAGSSNDTIQGIANKLPIIGGFVTDPEQERMRRQLAAVGQQYQAYRPEMRGANLNATNQALQAFAPANNALAALYGPQFTYDLNVSNPFSGPPAPVAKPGGSVINPAKQGR